MRKIEFCFFDAGGGHRAAAPDLELSIKSQKLPWNVQLANLQELMIELDILKKYAGIRIEDYYNWMLRSGWTLGSIQLMKVLQFAIRIRHDATVRLLTKYWKESNPDLLVSFVPHFNRALYESFVNAFPGRPFLTVLTDIADYPPHFWIERQMQYLVCGSDRAVAQAHAAGHSDEYIFRASGMILYPRFYEPHTEERGSARAKIAVAKVCRGLHRQLKQLHASRRFFYRQAGTRQRQRGDSHETACNRRMQCLDAAAGAL